MARHRVAISALGRALCLPVLLVLPVTGWAAQAYLAASPLPEQGDWLIVQTVNPGPGQPGQMYTHVATDGERAVPLWHWQAGEQPQARVRILSAPPLRADKSEDQPVSTSTRDQLSEDIAAPGRSHNARHPHSPIYSAPVIVGAGNAGYTVLPIPAGPAYSPWLKEKTRHTPLVLVASSAGLLHAFAAKTGRQTFIYQPRNLADQRQQLTTGRAAGKAGPHTRMACRPVVADAYFGHHWHTVAVAAIGPDCRHLVAVDLFPADPISADVLWEISPDSSEPAAWPSAFASYLGNMPGAPSVVRLENGHWVVLLGNGINSPGGHAALLVVDLVTGNLVKVLDTGAAGGNGLADVAAVDRDGNGSVDTVYAGDLQGNLWVFDLSSDAQADWHIAYHGRPLMTTTTAHGQRQPITVRPNVLVHPRGGVMVLFATGCGVITAVPGCPATQSVYGVWDNRADAGAGATRITGSDALVRQKAAGQGRVNGQTIQALTQQSVDYAGKRGWVFDLTGRRAHVAGDIRIIDGVAVMAVVSAQYTALVAIDPFTGHQFSQPVWDVNDDGGFDADDALPGNGQTTGEAAVYPAIVMLGEVANGAPLAMPRADGNFDILVPGSGQALTAMRLTSPHRGERVFWQQIR